MFKKTLAALLALFTAAAFAAVDVNKADQATLETVSGVGPSLAARIIKARDKAQFKDWPDLVNRVRGIGDRNAAKFSAAGLTVNDAAYTPPPATAKKPSYSPTGDKDKADKRTDAAGGSDAPPSVKAAGKDKDHKTASTGAKNPDIPTDAEVNATEEAKAKAKIEARQQARAAKKAEKAASAAQ